MRKLSLNLDSIEVESFATSSNLGGGGTVAGHDLVYVTTYQTGGVTQCGETCNGYDAPTCGDCAMFLSYYPQDCPRELETGDCELRT